MFILNMSVQICRATQFIHSLKRRAPLPSRSAASNSALVGASMPTCRRGNNFETVQKGNLMQCNAMHCNTMPSLERYLCKCTNLGQKKEVLLLQKKNGLRGLQMIYSQTHASINQDMSTNQDLTATTINYILRKSTNLASLHLQPGESLSLTSLRKA